MIKMGSMMPSIPRQPKLVFPVGLDKPQFGQFLAPVLTCSPHSRYGLSAILLPIYDCDRFVGLSSAESVIKVVRLAHSYAAVKVTPYHHVKSYAGHFAARATAPNQ